MNTTTWMPRTLSKCAKFLSGGTPSKANTGFWAGEIPWVSSGEMAETQILDTSLHITAEGAADGSRLVPANTVLAVVRGMSLAKEFRVAITRREVAFNQDLKAMIPVPDIDSQFLFYALFARREHIQGLATEASHGTKKLETDTLGAVQLSIPDLVTQRRVATIAKAYDSLIANNRRRIALLEEAARLLYQEWFVRLRFPGHEGVRVVDGVPEGWERKTLGEVTPLRYGKALKDEDRQPGPFAVYGSSGVVGSHERPLSVGPGLVIGRKGNVGSVFWSPRAFWPIDTAYFIDGQAANLFVYHALLNTHFINTDVAVPGLNREMAHSRELLMPPARLVREFLGLAEPMWAQIDRLQRFNEKLVAARDLLLPRLMSGEIAV